MARIFENKLIRFTLSTIAVAISLVWAEKCYLLIWTAESAIKIMDLLIGQSVFSNTSLALSNIARLQAVTAIWFLLKKLGWISEFNLASAMGFSSTKAVLCGFVFTGVYSFFRIYLPSGGSFSSVALLDQILIATWEEFAFRVIIVGVLEGRRWYNGLCSLVVSSTLFGLFHFHNYFFAHRAFGLVWRQVVSNFGTGLTFGVLRLSTGSLWPGVLLHIINNYNPITVEKSDGLNRAIKMSSELPFISNESLAMQLLIGILLSILYVLARYFMDGVTARYREV